jgi:phage baseplate assembly protein gpV
MVSSTPATGAWTAPSVDEQFLDLVCDNTDLLGAEFDAIIAAEWPTPPVDRRDVLAACRKPRDGAARWMVDTAHIPTRPRHPGIGGWARQRSPPRSNERPTDHT